MEDVIFSPKYFSSASSNDFSETAAGVPDIDECADFHLPLIHHCASVYSFTVQIFGCAVGLGEDRNAYTHVQLKNTQAFD